MNPDDNFNNWDSWEPFQEPVKPTKKRGGWDVGKVIALTLCCSVLAGTLGAGGAILYLRKDDASSQIMPELSEPEDNTVHILEGIREEVQLQVHEINTNKKMTAAEVYAANVNSTVGITTSVTTNFWGYQTTSAASGSGFIISQDGYILTNYHVIENSSAITVSCFDGTSYDASLIGYDESNDIAVLKVDATGLAPVILGSSDNTNVGESVIAIGNPLGELTFSLTAGTVSALNRQVTMSTGVTMELIQTDCAINSGNSGGALFNLYGEVIGITNAKYSGSSSSQATIDNIGFAIPMDDVRGIVESIIENGYISKPYIGVSVKDVSREIQSYGFPAGAAVQLVTDGGPAATAGLQISDIVTAINGEAITGSSDLVAVIEDSSVGDILTLTVYRQGNTIELAVTVGEQIQSALMEDAPSSQQQGLRPQYPWSR